MVLKAESMKGAEEWGGNWREVWNCKDRVPSNDISYDISGEGKVKMLREEMP